METVDVDIGNLTNSVSEGNRAAFNTLYRIYYDRVYRFAYYFLRDRQACNEVVSSVFVSIWHYRKRLPGVEDLNAYFWVVTKNEATRFRNMNKGYRTRSLDEIPIVLKRLDESHPEQILVTKELEELLTRIINELPERCRLVFLMARQEGLKSKEIAQILSITESTVRVQMKIAVGKIVEKLRLHLPDMCGLS